ncbi:MAG: hypothetical protein WC712_03035 [Candidatus Brocadiia bacterium]
MSEEKRLNPIVMVLGGLVLVAVAFGVTMVLLRETPQTVVRDFYECRSFDKLLMLLTPESARLLDDQFAREARRFGMSEDAYKREYAKYCPRLREITSVEKIDAVGNEWRIVSQLASVDSTGNEQTVAPQTLYVVRVNDTWKIDLTKNIGE